LEIKVPLSLLNLFVSCGCLLGGLLGLIFKQLVVFEVVEAKFVFTAFL
jgi:hypothetical protein